MFQGFLADAYFKRAIQYRNGNSWPETLRHYNKVLYYQPYESFYQENFAIDLRNGLDFYKNKPAKIEIIDLAIEAINNISRNNVDFRIIRNLAQIYMIKAGLTQNSEDFLKSNQLFQEITKILPKWRVSIKIGVN